MSILGHTVPLTYLSRAIQAGRLSPSLLFIGPEGVGKKLVTLELGKALLCPNPPSPENKDALRFGCDNCDTCRKVESGGHPDMFFLNHESQATLLREKPGSQTALKIEAVRHVEKFLQLKPHESRRRVTVLEDAQTLTNDAANALLKVLEEPPNNGQLILLSTDNRSLPSTVLSRCAVLRFTGLPVKKIGQWLNKHQGLDAEEAMRTAERSQGSLGKALKLMKEKEGDATLADLSLEEFFEALNNPQFRREARERSRVILSRMTDGAQAKLSTGDLTQIPRVELLLKSRRQLDRHVAPRLILEQVYLKLRSLQKDTRS